MAGITFGPKLGLLNNANRNQQYWDQFRQFLQAIDQLVQMSVINATQIVPPTNPSNGDAYLLIGGAPTGVWTGFAGSIAVWDTQVTTSGTDTQVPSWVFYTPQPGWIVWTIATASLTVYNGTSWIQVNSTNPSGAGNEVLATPDATTGIAALRTLVANDIPSILNATAINGTLSSTGTMTASSNLAVGTNASINGQLAAATLGITGTSLLAGAVNAETSLAVGTSLTVGTNANVTNVMTAGFVVTNQISHVSITAPAVTAANGTAVMLAGSSDIAGQVVFTASATSGCSISVSFHTPYANIPFVLLSAGNINAADYKDVYVLTSPGSPSNFVINCGSTPTVSGTTYSWNYMVIG